MYRTAYKPWGERIKSQTSGTDSHKYKYTAQEEDRTGLDYYKARFYDSELGQFLSADTMVPDPRESGSFNRYGYVNGNPVNRTDPTGHVWNVIFGAVIGAIIGACIGGYIAHKKGYSWRDKEFWQHVGFGAMIGAAIGAAIGSGFAPAASTGAQAVGTVGTTGASVAGGSAATGVTVTSYTFSFVAMNTTLVLAAFNGGFNAYYVYQKGGDEGDMMVGFGLGYAMTFVPGGSGFGGQVAMGAGKAFALNLATQGYMSQRYSSYEFDHDDLRDNTLWGAVGGAFVYGCDALGAYIGGNLGPKVATGVKVAALLGLTGGKVYNFTNNRADFRGEREQLNGSSGGSRTRRSEAEEIGMFMMDSLTIMGY